MRTREARGSREGPRRSSPLFQHTRQGAARLRCRGTFRSPAAGAASRRAEPSCPGAGATSVLGCGTRGPEGHAGEPPPAPRPCGLGPWRGLPRLWALSCCVTVSAVKSRLCQRGDAQGTALGALWLSTLSARFPRPVSRERVSGPPSVPGCPPGCTRKEHPRLRGDRGRDLSPARGLHETAAHFCLGFE